MSDFEDYSGTHAIPNSLEKSPVALYMSILSLAPPDWTPEDVQELYLMIMAEYEEVKDNPLSVVSLDKSKH